MTEGHGWGLRVTEMCFWEAGKSNVEVQDYLVTDESGFLGHVPLFSCFTQG